MSIPSQRETYRRIHNLPSNKEAREKAESKAQLERVSEEIKKATVFPIKYTGSLNALSIREIEARGWKVKNTYVHHEWNGPGTMPSWEIF